MSNLTIALDRIMNWLQHNQPNFSASFLPGLTDEQIMQIIEYLPYSLPEEIYELYRWRNGTRQRQEILFYPSMAFLPLEDALVVGKETIDLDERTEYKLRFEGQRLFPFLDNEGDICAVAVNNKKQKASPIISIPSEYNECHKCYNSLTSMMQTIAECYETGAYYLVKEVFVEEDKNKSLQLFHKYNPEILEG